MLRISIANYTACANSPISYVDKDADEKSDRWWISRFET